MPKPFHRWLPEWALNGLKKRSCSQCKTKYTPKDIIAIGIRQIKKNNECAMYIEHICSKCEYQAVTVLGKEKEDSLEGMCCVILESIKRKKLAEKSRLFRKQKEDTMTDKEVNSFIKFIKDAKTHEDFCKEIGTNPLKEDDQNDTS